MDTARGSCIQHLSRWKHGRTRRCARSLAPFSVSIMVAQTQTRDGGGALEAPPHTRDSLIHCSAAWCVWLKVSLPRGEKSVWLSFHPSFLPSFPEKTGGGRRASYASARLIETRAHMRDSAPKSRTQRMCVRGGLLCLSALWRHLCLESSATNNLWSCERLSDFFIHVCTTDATGRASEF